MKRLINKAAALALPALLLVGCPNSQSNEVVVATDVHIPPPVDPPRKTDTVTTPESTETEVSAATVKELARQALKRPVAFNTVNRIEIHSEFPRAGEVRDKLVDINAPFTDSDWFGSTVDMPPRWEVSIGEDVDVSTAQAVIAACLLAGSLEIKLVGMDQDEGFSNRRRIYIGNIDAQTGPSTPLSDLAKILKQGISRREFYALF
ncbi:MAG: hypothetical protein IPK82_38270 [Polyangiaceae bacterium]|nr:hypothetical protein [Polyangiaceae bacterium]